MKTIKKWLMLVLSVLMMTSLAAGLISCGKHEHTYTAEVIAPTCTEAGYTKHTCDCGESYTDTEVPAIGHDYDTQVIKYPSATETGERKHTCAICNDVKTETIDALAITMPKVSDVLVNVIGAFSAKIAIDEGSTIVSNYNAEEFKATDTIEFEVAEAVLSTQDGKLAGHLKLEIKDTFQEEGQEASEYTLSIYAYVNGDDVAFEIDDGEKVEGEFAVSEELYKMLANKLGLTYDQVVTFLNVGQEVIDYLPALMDLAKAELPAISKDYVDGLKQLFETFGQEIIVATEKEGNIAYTVNIDALSVFVEEIEGETIGTYVDKVFGAGSTNAVKGFIVSLPEKTVKEIATGAISIAKTYDIDVNNVYYLVNLVARNLGATDFDIKALIESQYNVTFAQLIGADDMPIEQVKAMLGQYVDTIVNMDADQLFAMITGETEISFIEEIKASIEVFAEIIAVEIVFDTQGAFVSASLESPFVEIGVANGEYKLVCNTENAYASFIANVDGVNFSIAVEGNEYINFDFNVENGLPTDVKLVVGGWNGEYQEIFNEETGERDYVYVRTEFETKAELIAEFTFDQNGFMTAIDGEIYGWGYEASDNIYDEDVRVYRKQSTIEYKATADVDGSVETINFVATSWISQIEDYVKVVDIAYADNDGATSIDMIIENAIIDIDKQITETGAIWSLKGYAINPDPEGENMLVLKGELSSVVEESKVTYNADLKINVEEGFKDALDFTMVVNNGQITSLNYRYGGVKLPNGTIYSSDYETQYVIERFIIPNVGITYDSEEKTFTYNIQVATGEYTTVSVWNPDYGYWEVVEETEQLTGGINMLVSMQETEDGVILNVNGIEVDLSALENGLEIELNTEGLAEGVITITMDENGALNIDYDIEGIATSPYVIVSGVGGIQISIA